MIIVRPNPKYSESFKRKVLTEIANGEISIEGARRKYGIGGSMTIPKWRKKMINFPTKEKGDPRMPEELRIVELLAENERLRKQLLEKEMESVILKKMIEISENLKDSSVKKKIEQELLKLSEEKKENPTEDGTQLASCADITE
jgi:transposase-like protein